MTSTVDSATLPMKDSAPTLPMLTLLCCGRKGRRCFHADRMPLAVGNVFTLAGILRVAWFKAFSFSCM